MKKSASFEQFEDYASRITRLLVEEEIIIEDEQEVFEQFVRGCA